MTTANPLACHCRPLTPLDVQGFHALRMQALIEHPKAFATSPEEQAALPLAFLEQALAATPEQWVLGMWLGDELMGCAGLQRKKPAKLAHKADIWGVYVHPAHRRQGWADALLSNVLERAHNMPGLLQVQLGVSSHNTAAIALYQRHGFVRFGTEPRSLCVDGVFYDEDWMSLQL